MINMDTLKSKSFWGKIGLTVGGFLTGALTAPDAIMQIVTSIFGG